MPTKTKVDYMGKKWGKKDWELIKKPLRSYNYLRTPTFISTNPINTCRPQPLTHTHSRHTGCYSHIDMTTVVLNVP